MKFAVGYHIRYKFALRVCYKFALRVCLDSCLVIISCLTANATGW